MTSQVRDQVFETNSSSTHSLTLVPDEILDFSIDPKALRSGELVIHPGEYGWNWHRYYRMENKLAYLLTQVAGQHLNDMTVGDDLADRLKDLYDEARFLIETVEEATACKIRIEGANGASSISAYVDGASYGIGTDLIYNKDALLSFLFSKKSYIQTGNDNGGCGEFIKTDLDELEPFYIDRYAEPDADMETITFKSGPSSRIEDPSISLTHSGKGDIEITDTSFATNNRMMNALRGAILTGGRVVGRERWDSAIKHTSALQTMKPQEVRDVFYEIFEHLKADNNLPALMFSSTGSFSGLNEGRWHDSYNYSFEADFSLTPKHLEDLWALAQDLNATQSSPKP